MLFTDVIRTKRDGGALTAHQIAVLADGLTTQSLPPEQVSALAMAIFLNGMNVAETGLLTRAMARSGTIIDWSGEDLDGPVVDKHSTGGVGDKVSLLLAPMAAACGCFVPMISGRGLGHTGGTLDKLDAIPGYQSQPGLGMLKRVVRQVGCAIIGQTEDLAPADKRFYAIRDITGTVESIPLITASILSKKKAAGNQALVMDVKVGNGAFMDHPDRAKALAQSLMNTGTEIGLTVQALITDMNQVLGTTAGNALEVKEALDCLTGKVCNQRLCEVTMALTTHMLLAAGLASHETEARKAVETVLTSGRAAEIFARMIAELGGPLDFVDRYEQYLEPAPICLEVKAQRAGYVAYMNTRTIGQAVIALGGGRTRLDDRLDLRVGFSDVIHIGQAVEPGQTLAVVHANEGAKAQAAAKAFADAITLAQEKPERAPVIYPL